MLDAKDQLRRYPTGARPGPNALEDRYVDPATRRRRALRAGQIRGAISGSIQVTSALGFVLYLKRLSVDASKCLA